MSWLTRLWRGKSGPEVGQVTNVKDGLVTVSGLPSARSGELVLIESVGLGQIVALRESEIDVVALDPGVPEAGEEVRLTGELPTVPVGPQTAGVVLDPLGRPQPPVESIDGPRRRLGEPGPAFLDHDYLGPYSCLETGVKGIDIMLPIRTGEVRVLAGPLGSGKTTLAAQILRHRARLGKQSVLVSVGAGQGRLSRTLQDLGTARERVSVVAAPADSPSSLQRLAFPAGVAVAASLRDEGEEALLVVDSLNRAFDASLSHLNRTGLSRHSPVPWGSIEAACCHAARLKQGGSLTILLIVETPQGHSPRRSPLFKSCGGLPGIPDDSAGAQLSLLTSRTLLLEGQWPPIDYVASSPSCPVFRRHLRGYGAKLLATYAAHWELLREAGGELPLEEAWDKTHSERIFEWARRCHALIEQPVTETIPLQDQVALFAAFHFGFLEVLDMSELLPFSHALFANLESEQKLRDALREGCPGGTRPKLERFVDGALEAWTQAKSV